MRFKIGDIVTIKELDSSLNSKYGNKFMYRTHNYPWISMPMLRMVGQSFKIVAQSRGNRDRLLVGLYWFHESWLTPRVETSEEIILEVLCAI